MATTVPQVMTMEASQVAVAPGTTEITEISAENAYRRYLLIKNEGPNTIWIGWDDELLDEDTGFQVLKDEYVEFTWPESMFKEALYAVADDLTDDCIVHVIEGTGV